MARKYPARNGWGDRVGRAPRLNVHGLANHVTIFADGLVVSANANDPVAVAWTNDGDWSVFYYPDGLEQIRLRERENKGKLYIERVNRPKSRRIRWCVVDRTINDRLYPPRIAGPFKELDAAKATYLLLLSTMG